MAEAKYDLMLVQTKTDKKIYEQPWYKERLKTSYTKSMGPNATSTFFDSSEWSFIKDGLDDFRDGLPPVVDGEEIIKGYKGIRPTLKGSSDNISSVKQPAAPKRFTKDQICYTKATPQQQDRRDHIDDIEFGLKQHPLALYPHLEESVPPEVFEDVVDILDPELNLGSDEEDENEETERNNEEGGEEDDQLPDINDPSQNTLDEQGEGRKPVKNPYKWLPKKEEKEKKEKKKGDRRSPSPDQDDHIKQVAKDFCDWVADLGGETNNIEETTVMSLFASGYETKPALSVPIHVVELSNVPAELRMSATDPPTASQPADNIPKHSQESKNWSYSGAQKPDFEKQRYGAWYLPPKTWRKMPANEPLQDQKNLKDLEMSDVKAKSHNLDSELAPMHGVKAFMDFIGKKDQRQPEFLNRVRDIQESSTEEESQSQVEPPSKTKGSNKGSQSKR